MFSHIVANCPSPEITQLPQSEAAFAIHVHHRELPPLETWIGGTHSFSPHIAPGGMCIFDLRAAPVALVSHPLDFSRLCIKNVTLGEMAYNRGLSAFNLSVAPFGYSDPIIYNLTLALKSRLEVYGEDIDTVFVDSIALALIDRILTTYSGAGPGRITRGSLSEAQYRRVSDFIDSNIAHSLSLTDLAGIVEMHPDRFARVFKRLMGMPVHQWLMMRRVEKAKDLLRSTDLSISQIAFDCGFVDQSHLTRVLRKYSATTPREWRLGSRG